MTSKKNSLNVTESVWNQPFLEDYSQIELNRTALDQRFLTMQNSKFEAKTPVAKSFANAKIDQSQLNLMLESDTTAIRTHETE